MSPEQIANPQNYNLYMMAVMFILLVITTYVGPGHGYPEHTETTVQYVVYGDRASWEAEIKKRMTATLVYSPRQWAPLICRRPEIGVTVDVRIK